MQQLERHKDLLWMVAVGAAATLTQDLPPQLLALACLGLFVPLQAFAIVQSLRATAWAAREVEASADLLRSPELEALLEGFRPLHVLALSVQELRVAQPYWFREATLAEIAMLPEGPHLRLSSLRPDGGRPITAQPQPLLHTLSIPAAERELVADPRALLQQHAARIAAAPVLPMDRALSLGIARQGC
jgi:hypothetical protein